MHLAGSIRTLLIERDPGNAAEPVLPCDTAGPGALVVERVEGLEAGLERLGRGGVDLILLALAVLDTPGVQALGRLRSSAPDIPVVVLCAQDDEAAALTAIMEGAQDVLSGEGLDPAVAARTLRHAVERHRSSRQLLEESHRRSEEHEKAVVEKERLDVLLQMAGAMAHEMNQPLTVLLSSLDLLKMNGQDPDRRRRHLDNIHEAGSRLAEIVKRVQNLRRDETVPYAGSSAIVDLSQRLDILLVLRDDAAFERLSRLLSEVHGRVGLTRAREIYEAGKRLDEKRFDLVFSEVLLPDGDGLSLLKVLEWEEVESPVIFLTPNDDARVTQRLQEAGALACLPLDRIDREALQAHVGKALEEIRISEDVRELRERMRELGPHDPVTGLSNRRFLKESLEREMHRGARYGTDLVLVLIRADRFDELTSSASGVRSEECLRELGHLLRGCFRQSDLVCRFDETTFGVLLPQTDADSACIAFERFRGIVEGHRFAFVGAPVRITVSAGLSSLFGTGARTTAELVSLAGHGLQAAEKAGGNRVTTSRKLDPPGGAVQRPALHADGVLHGA